MYCRQNMRLIKTDFTFPILFYQTGRAYIHIMTYVFRPISCNADYQKLQNTFSLD